MEDGEPKPNVDKAVETQTYLERLGEFAMTDKELHIKAKGNFLSQVVLCWFG